MKQVVVFPRGQLSESDRKRLVRAGVVVVEADDPSKVVTVLRRVRTYEEVMAANDPKEEILRSNMRCNRYAAVVDNTNSYRSVLPLGKDDVVVDERGEIIAKGADYKMPNNPDHTGSAP
jgi:hypothetical protein